MTPLYTLIIRHFKIGVNTFKLWHRLPLEFPALLRKEAVKFLILSYISTLKH